MAQESKDKGSMVGVHTFRWRPVSDVLGPPELLPAGGPALGEWTHPLDELAERSREAGHELRRRIARAVRESVTCALAIVWVTLVGCASTLGWRHPRRVLTAGLVFAVPWFFLALPAHWVTLHTWSEFVSAGHWAMSARLTAGLLGGGLIVFHLVMALVQVPQAREQIPVLCLEERLAQAGSLLTVQVATDEQLRDWLARTSGWTAAVEKELRALHSPAVAYAFRRVSPGEIVRHAHRYDAVHDGWLNLTAWRRDLLADLLDPRARRSATRRPSEFRQVA